MNCEIAIKVYKDQKKLSFGHKNRVSHHLAESASLKGASLIAYKAGVKVQFRKTNRCYKQDFLI